MTWMAGQVAALFTAPMLAAAGAAAVSIPIAIHLLSRLRRTRIAWAAMRFLEEAWKRQRRRMQIEQLILLAVRCLLMVILGLALAGPQSALLGALGLSQSHRLVVIVLDDSLVSQVEDASGQQRFAQLQAAAMAVAQAVAPGDELALWTLAGQEDRQRIAPGPADRQAARRVIESLAPSQAPGDLAAVLTEVARVVEDRQMARDRVSVVVLSDFHQATLDPALPAPAELEGLAQQAVIWLHRPGLEAGNTQVTSLASTRGLVMAQPATPASVPLTITLSRFGQDLRPALSNVMIELALARGDQAAVAGEPRQFTRPVRWTAGQRQAVVHVDAPLGVIGPDITAMLGRATVRSVTNDDRLPGDDTRFIALPVTQGLRLAMIDEPAVSENSFGPATWARLALSPQPGSAMTLVALQPSMIEREELTSFDAMMVFRPDLLTPGGWRKLAQAADEGRLVWVFAPASETTTPWPARMTEALAPAWAVNPEPASRESQPWQLLASQRAPEPLGMLGPDWQALLGPVRVMKLLPVSLPAVDTRSALWLQTASEQRPVLLSHPQGRGSVLLMTAALDPTWTDLMLKPLFVPLMHEAILGSLGEMSLRQRGLASFAGQRLTLARNPSGIPPDSLERFWPERNASRDESRESLRLPLQPVADGWTTAQPVRWPGLYHLASPSVHDEHAPAALLPAKLPAAVRQSQWLAVNIQPEAGDTTAVLPTAVQNWFGLNEAEEASAAFGRDWPWLDVDDPAAFLAGPVTQADLGWPLLWTLLGLVLLETWLARRLSYAQQAQRQPSWFARWWQRMVS